ncbi:hypothetical protein BD413DRAFT_519350 [Trametes elegans]|nr:hypothetical protein BD413DRAFT_519350 [Trametes elegans]
MQAAIFLSPKTPTRPTYTSPTGYSHIPLRSSPLASPTSSPAANASARRRSQYKATPSSSSAPQRMRDMEAQRRYLSAPRVDASASNSKSSAPPTEEAPRKAFLRERLKARCIERAAQKRSRAVARGSRHMSSDGSSDGVDEMMDEDDEDEDSMLNDELFRRIVDSAKRKERHAYRVSYACDVGSSFDPDMEDPGSWESELQNSAAVGSVTPDDLLDEELEAYAAEADLNLDDLPIDEIFAFSDYEDGGPSGPDDDVDMH